MPHQKQLPVLPDAYCYYAFDASARFVPRTACSVQHRTAVCVVAIIAAITANQSLPYAQIHHKLRTCPCSLMPTIPLLPESRLGLHAPCSMEPLYLLATSLATSRLDHPRQRFFMRTAMCIGSRLQEACPSRLAHMRSTVDSAAHTEHPQAVCVLAAQTKRASYSEPTACRVGLKAITGNPQDAHRMQ